MANYLSTHTGAQIDEVVAHGLNGDYTPPTTLAELTEDTTHRVVTDAEKSTWNGKSVVSFSQTLASGTEVGALTINGTTTKLYAPSGGGGGGGAVDSVNGKTGDVVLTYSDVNALSDATSIPSALSDLTADSTHRLVTDTEKSTWNAKQAALSFVTTPTSTNKVLTKTEMGQYQRETAATATPTTTLQTNTQYDYDPDTALTSASWTLGTPSANGTNEWSVGFKAGSGFSLSVTPPTGYTLKWKDGVPSFTEGKFYELSFLQHTDYVIGIAAEISLA